MRAKLDKDRIFMFVKFQNNKDHLLAMQKGQLWMNNGQYFIDREKQDGVQGIGDRYELNAVINDVKLRFYKHGTDELILKGEAGRFAYTDHAILSKPILCLTHISHDSLKIINENEDSVDCVLNFDGQGIEKIISDFGEYALVISPNQFLDSVKKSFSEQKLNFISDKVVYENFSINSAQRIKDYHRGNPSLFFYKDKSFEHQKEYRIVVTNIETNNTFTPNIGSIADCSIIMETRELFSGKFALNISKA